MPRLGEMLVEEKLCSSAQIEEGLETQVVHGGRLGTNLVELGFLQERDLARVLGRQHNVSYAAGEMQPDPAAMKLSDAAFCDDHDILPMRIDARALTVAVMDPRRIEPLDKLGFKAGKRVVPVVIPEFRMNQLLRRFCKAFRTLRPIDMNTLRPSKAAAETHGGPVPTQVGELINEDDFAKLYAQAAAGGGAAAVDDEVIVEGVEIEVPPPGEPAPTAPARGQGRKPQSGSAIANATTPLGFAEAQGVLAQCQDREEVARTVLRFAVRKFKRAVILSVQGDLVTGWHGGGAGVRNAAVRRIGVSLREANTFKLVRDTSSHYVGAMRAGPSTDAFFKLLGGGYPGSAVMMPLLVRGKLVHIVYVDVGPQKMTPPDIGELLILSQSVGRAYEAMILKRKAQRV